MGPDHRVSFVSLHDNGIFFFFLTKLPTLREESQRSDNDQSQVGVLSIQG